jgi:glycine hydroxymethyltransferase
MEELRKIKEIVKNQNRWRSECLNLIASENVLSPLAEKFLVSDFVGRYNEHGIKDGEFEEHYQGVKFSSEIEKICIQIFSRRFKTPYVDVRPISGAIANLAVYSAILKPGDVFLSPGLTFGGHVSSTEYGIAGVCGLKSIPMPFDERKMQLNVKETVKLIKKVKPKLIMLGRSMFLFPEPIREIRKYTKAMIVYDAAHVFGLIYGGKFQDPFKEGADIITASTHKTFPGPQGGIILGNPKLDKKIWKKIQRAIFPGIVSNHHIFRLPSLAITALEMNRFGKDYASQTIKNAKTLARELFKIGFNVLGKENGFTQSHQVIVNVKEFGGGKVIAEKLEEANIIVNKMALPKDKDIDATQNPSGIRIGVQEMTRFGMKEKEMKKIAYFIKKVVLDKIEPKEVKKEVINFRKKFQEIKYCFKA